MQTRDVSQQDRQDHRQRGDSQRGGDPPQWRYPRVVRLHHFPGAEHIIRMVAKRSPRSRALLLALFAAIVVIDVVIFPWASRTMGIAGVPFRPLDLRLSYSADEAYTVISSMTPEARWLYRTVEMSVDMIYPVIYAFFFFLLVQRLIANTAPPRWLERATSIPFAAMIFDWLENVGIIAMISKFPDGMERIAPVSSAMTTLKWVCFALTLALLFYSAIRWVISRFRRRAPGPTLP